MVRLKFAAVHLVIDGCILYLLVRAFVFGYGLWKQFFSINFLPINFVIGCVAAASANFLAGLAKKTILFFAKSATIYSICKGEQSVAKSIAAVTCDLKETITVPAVNLAVRQVLKSIGDLAFSEGEVPEFVKGIIPNGLWKLTKPFVMVVLDNADECVLAWCYAHDDVLLNDCMNGLAAFFKHAIELIAFIMPVVIIKSLINIATGIVCIWIYVTRIGISLDTAALAYLVIYSVLFILNDVVLEPFTMDSVVKKYCKCTEGEEAPNDVLETIGASVNLDSINSILGRFSDSGTGNEGEET